MSQKKIVKLTNSWKPFNLTSFFGNVTLKSSEENRQNLVNCKNIKKSWKPFSLTSFLKCKQTLKFGREIRENEELILFWRAFLLIFYFFIWRVFISEKWNKINFLKASVCFDEIRIDFLPRQNLWIQFFSGRSITLQSCHKTWFVSWSWSEAKISKYKSNDSFLYTTFIN